MLGRAALISQAKTGSSRGLRRRTSDAAREMQRARDARRGAGVALHAG
jgi:hypothetical protein